MKKLFILFATGLLLVSCSDTKDLKKTEKDDPEKKDEPKKTNAKKPDTTGKVVLHDHFDKVDVEDITKEDKNGWPEARKEEIRKMCMEDVGYDGPEAKAYCNCQLDNAMKIFASYKEAMTIFNKSEDELSEDEWNKLMQMEETDGNCMEQNYEEDGMSEDEKDGM